MQAYMETNRQTYVLELKSSKTGGGTKKNNKSWATISKC